MRIATSIFRSGALASLSFALLAAALPLAAQTSTNPAFSFATDLRFAHQVGTPAPPPQTVRLYSAPGNVQYTATAATSTGAGWLAVNGALQATGTTGGTSSAGTPDIQISVSPNLPVGTYNGTVTVASGERSIPINVTLTVTPNPVLRTDPASLVHTTVEARRTATLPLQIGSSQASTTIPYSAQVINAAPNTGWLTVLPNAGFTGQAAQIAINAEAIPSPNTLGTAIIVFTPQTGGPAITIPVSVNITPGAQLVVSPTTVTIPYQIGFTVPPTRSVSIASSTQTQLIWNASITTAAPWLTISSTQGSTTGTTFASGSTPGSLYLIPNIAAVAATPQTHEAKVRIEAPSTGASQEITVRLVVSNQPQLIIQPESANFSYTLGGTLPTAQQIAVSSTSFAQQFTVTPTYTTGGQWFTVSPQTAGSTPQSLTISVDPTRLTQLGAGTYSGSVRLASATSTLDVPVNLTVGGSTLITVEPAALPAFEATQGQTPPARTLIVRSTDSTNQPFNTTVEYGTGASNWLIVSPQSGSTGTVGTFLTLNVNPSAVSAPGTYQATLVITPTGTTSAPSFRVPVTYIVTGSAQVTASVTRVEATQIGTTAPQNQVINLTSSTPGLTFIASANQSWLTVTPSTGTIPGSVTVQFNTSNLTPGDYTAQITISVSGVTTITIPVALRVQSAAALQVAPAGPLNFTFTQGGSAPAAQTVALTSTGGAIAFTTAASSTGSNWLRVEPASGTTAASGGAATNLRITADPAGLTAGTYTGTVTISAPGASNATTTINVTLTVTAQAVPTGITFYNSASGLSRGVAPGALITIKGRNMAPSTPAETQVVNGRIATTLSDVRVLFDGVEAPLTYVGPAGDRNGDQINAFVPFSISGRATTRMVVEYRGARSEALELVVRETDIGIYTANASGSGQGAVLNQDNSVNGASNPAARGTVVQVYATGEGLSVPAQATGAVVTAGSLPRPLLPVSARVHGQPASVEYAGGVPGLAAGVLQVNVRIPANLAITAPTNVPIEIIVGTQASQPGVTVAVRP